MIMEEYTQRNGEKRKRERDRERREGGRERERERERWTDRRTDKQTDTELEMMDRDRVEIQTETERGENIHFLCFPPGTMDKLMYASEKTSLKEKEERKKEGHTQCHHPKHSPHLLIIFLFSHWRYPQNVCNRVCKCQLANKCVCCTVTQIMLLTV